MARYEDDDEYYQEQYDLRRRREHCSPTRAPSLTFPDWATSVNHISRDGFSDNVSDYCKWLPLVSLYMPHSVTPKSNAYLFFFIDMNDQGWGNRKGEISIPWHVVHDGPAEHTRSVFSSLYRLRPRDWCHPDEEKAVLRRRPVRGRRVAGDAFGYEVPIEYKVGGGGGHILYVHHFQGHVLLAPSASEWFALFQKVAAATSASTPETEERAVEARRVVAAAAGQLDGTDDYEIVRRSLVTAVGRRLPLIAQCLIAQYLAPVDVPEALRRHTSAQHPARWYVVPA